MTARARPGRRASPKAWAGRFAAPTHPAVDAFTTSLPVDRRLAIHDVRGSVAHCRMLVRQRIIPRRDGQRILRGLARVAQELEGGRFRFRSTDEDIHMAIERRLIEIVGPVGGKLHTARSRNDQVALDVRLYLRDAIGTWERLLAGLRKALCRLAWRHRDALMPGYTHLQRAQPVLFAHHLLAYHDMLARDAERLADCSRRVNVLPLGAGALAGTTFPIDRRYVARLLGFRGVAANSIDAVSDRDFVVEFLADAAILAMHLSRLAGELVLWSSEEFGFVEWPDSLATGSSIMPQKKNPDVAELVRARTGRVYGNLLAVLTTLKGLPLAYNRDLQEDKPPLFDTMDTVGAALGIMTLAISAVRINRERMAAAARSGLMLATELADYLARRGVPFREAHATVGRLVRDCLKEGRDLGKLRLADLRRASPRFGPDALRLLDPHLAVERRHATGGTAGANVRRRLARLLGRGNGR